MAARGRADLRRQALDSGEASLVQLLLREQQQLTAVERFAERHDRDHFPEQGQHYPVVINTSRTI